MVSHGGKQELHPEFFNWFPCMQLKKDNVILADRFLKRQGFNQIIEKINAEKIKKVVIIGGSHSGFSAAWMLLNGPADVLHNTHVRPTC